MDRWILENMASIVVGSLLFLAVLMAIGNIMQRKKKGKSLCSCDCASCPLGSSCHKK